jgi:hypothetical protein
MWREKENLRAATMSSSPQVIVDFESFPGDRPTRRERVLIARNLGPATAVNIRVDPFVVGDTTVICYLVNRLLPNTDTAKLTAEIRRERDVRKPCLVDLERLFELAYGQAIANEDVATALTMTYADLAGRRYRAEYSIRYRRGINECEAELKTLHPIA